MSHKYSRFFSALLACILLPLFGCGSGGNQSNAKIGTLIAADFATAHNVEAMTIFSDGTIAQVHGSPFAASGPPTAVAAAASSGLVFVTCSSGNLNGSVSEFKISADGTLTSTGPPATSFIIPLSMSLPSTGKFLLVNYSGPVIYSVDASTGTLKLLTAAGANGPGVFSPDGNLILTVNGSSMESYSLSTGAPALVSSLLEFFETQPSPPIVHPSGKFVYVPYSSANIIGGVAPPPGIAGFSVAAGGTLAVLPGSPFGSGTSFGSSAAGTGFKTAVFDPSGTHLYAESDSAVYGFTIDQSSGSLAPIPGAFPFTRGSPLALAFDPSGKYLFVSEFGGISSYSVGSDGLPKLVQGSPFAIGHEITSLVSVP